MPLGNCDNLNLNTSLNLLFHVSILHVVAEGAIVNAQVFIKSNLVCHIGRTNIMELLL